MIGLKSILRFSSKKWCEGYVTVFLILHTDNTREVSTETFYNFIKNWKIKTIIFLHLPLKLFLPVLVDNVLMLGTEAALLLLLMKLLLILDIRDLGGGGGGGGISGFRLTSVWNKLIFLVVLLNEVRAFIKHKFMISIIYLQFLQSWSQVLCFLLLLLQLIPETSHIRLQLGGQWERRVQLRLEETLLSLKQNKFKTNFEGI